jgi:hypothetical protein
MLGAVYFLLYKNSVFLHSCSRNAVPSGQYAYGAPSWTSDWLILELFAFTDMSAEEHFFTVAAW